MLPEASLIFPSVAKLSLSQATEVCRLTHLTVKNAILNLEKLHPNVISEAGDMKEPLISQISLSLRILLYHFRKCAMSQTAWARCLGSYRGTLKDLEPIVIVLKKIKPSFDPEEEPELPQRPACITPVEDWMGMQALAPIPGFWKVNHWQKKGDPSLNQPPNA